MMVVGASITGVFFLFIIIGILLGLARGFVPSIIRFVTVIISAIIAYFVTASVVESLLQLDLSTFGWTIGGIEFTNVNTTMISLLQSFPYVSDIISLSPTFRDFVLILPSLVLNLVVFVLLFFIVKAIMWILYKIVSKIFSPKKKKGEIQNKHRLIGALTGAVQGIFCFVLTIIPALGIVNIANNTVEYVNTYNSASNSGHAEIAVASFSQLSTQEAEEESVMSFISTEEISRFLNPIKQNWVVKTLDFLGVGKMADIMFDGLTTFEIKKTETNIRKEISTITALAVRGNRIASGNLANLSIEDIRVVDEMVDLTFESPLLKNIVGEAVPNIASEWSSSSGSSLIGYTRPNFGEMEGIADSFLLALSIASPTDIEKDFKSASKVLMVTNTSGKLNSISAGGDSAFEIFSDKMFIQDIVDAMVQGPSFKRTLPSIFNTGLSFIYPLIDVPQDKGVVEERFYEKLILANERYVIDENDENLESGYKSAFRYFDVKVVETAPLEDVDFGFVTQTQLETMVASCKTFTTAQQFEDFFNQQDMNVFMGFVVVETDLVIKKSSSDIEWNTEKVILADIFSGMFNVYKNDSSKTESQTALDVVDFYEFALVLDNIRKSQLLDDIDQHLILAFLQSSILDDLVIGQAFMDCVKDKEKFESVNFVDLFNTLTVIRDLESFLNGEGSSLSDSDVSTLLEILTGEDDTMKGIIQDMSEKEGLMNSGLDENKADAISSLVNGILESGETTQSEYDAEAMESAVLAMENASKNEAVDNEGVIFKSDISAYTFVNNVMNSPIIFASTIGNPNYHGFDNANDFDRDFVLQAISDWRSREGYTPNSADDEKLSLIATRFGTTWSA